MSAVQGSSERHTNYLLIVLGHDSGATPCHERFVCIPLAKEGFNPSYILEKIVFDKNSYKKTVATVLCLLPATGLLVSGCASNPPSAPPMSDEAAAFVSLARAEMRNDKVLMVSKAMQLSPEDPNYNAFWHEYYKYEAEMKDLNNERLEVIRDYQFNFDKMDDGIADNLASRALSIHKRRLDLLGKYYQLIKRSTSPVLAARFMQVEHQINLILDVEIASQLPLLIRQ